MSREANRWAEFGLSAVGGYMAGKDRQERKAEHEADRKWQEEQRGWQRTDRAKQDAAAGYLKSDPGLSDASGTGAAPPEQTQDMGTQPDAQATQQFTEGMTPPPDAGLGGASAMPQTNSPGLADGKRAPNMQSHAKRVLATLDTGMERAVKAGDIDAYGRFFDQASKVRGIAREHARETADQKFVATGDFSAYIPVQNEWLDNGVQIHSIDQDEKQNYTIRGTQDGKPFERPVGDRQAMIGMVNQMFDPKASRQMEAQYRAKQWESNLKISEQKQIDDHKTQNDMGLEDHKAGLKPPEVIKASGGEGRPDRVGIQGKDGTVKWQDGGAEAEAGPLDIKTTNALRSAIMGMYKVSDMESMSPDIRERVGNAMTYSSMLIQSNQGTDAGKRLDVNTAAPIAAQIADGKVPEQKFTDKSGNIWRGVTVGGVKYLLDPQPLGRAGQAPTGGKAAPVDATTRASPREVSGKIRGQPAAQEVRYDAQGNAFVRGPDGRPVPYRQ